MFTGIIQNRGIVVRRTANGQGVRLAFRFVKSERRALQIGESIAVSGTCLTVAKHRGRLFEADVIRETLAATTLGSLKAGDSVNLERSLRWGDSVGGHLVSGHVDGRGKVTSVKKEKDRVALIIAAPAHVMAFVAPKGSVAVDGISLTVQRARRKSFEVALIPHTLAETTLSQKKAGSAVNLEADRMARYVPERKGAAKAKAKARHKTPSLAELKRQGF